MKEEKKVTRKINGKKSPKLVEDEGWTTDCDNLNPRSDVYLQKVADELRSWCHREDVIKVTQFYPHIKCYADPFNEWCKRYKPLEEARLYATQVIGDRRELYGLQNKYNANIVEKTMGMYDSKYKEFLKWKAEIAKPQQVTNETKVVVIERFPSSDLVPEKK